MFISSGDWKRYISKLSALDEKAGSMMTEWIQKNGFGDTDALIDYAYALATKYGEGSAALSAAMYDAIADLQGVMKEPAVVAPTPTRNEVAKAVNGILKHSTNPSSISGMVSRLVKRTGADTTLQNAERDGAQFAWVPNGDTCAFCITLASRGWQYMSSKARKNGHAEHIHGNCDCTYAVRFDNKSGIKGYDPKVYEDMYYGAEGDTPKDRINSIRRMKYQENKDRINAQKRAAYAERKSVLRQENRTAKPPEEYSHNYDDFNQLTISDEEREKLSELHRLSRESGYEYGVIIENGVEHEPETSYNPDRVRVSLESISNEHAYVLHSHTGNTPPSAIDLEKLVNERIDKIEVVTDNEDVFAVFIGDGWRPTLDEFKEVEIGIRADTDNDMVEQAMNRGWTPEELTYMCIREQLYRTCIRFGWTVEGGPL